MILFGLAAISSIVPAVSNSPPRTPGPGPKSTIVSAASMVSSSCSTTMRVLPRSRSRSSEASNCALSRGCKPIEGSSRTYKTPTKPAPIWLANRMRCDSPPDKVGAVRSSERYESPTSSKNFSRARTSLMASPPMVICSLVKSKLLKKSAQRSSESREQSPIASHGLD